MGDVLLRSIHDIRQHDLIYSWKIIYGNYETLGTLAHMSCILARLLWSETIIRELIIVNVALMREQHGHF